MLRIERNESKFEGFQWFEEMNGFFFELHN